MPLIASAVIGGVSAIGKGILGASELAESKRLRKQAGARPQYNIEDEFFNNQSLAESMAMNGLSQSSKDLYGRNAERGLGAGISATLAAGGNPNAIQNLYDTYDTNNLKLASQDAELKNSNIKYLMDTNKELAAQKSIQWSLNKLDPWKDLTKASAQAKDAGINNIFGAASQASSTLSAYAVGKQNEQLLDKSQAMPGRESIAPVGYAGVTASQPPIAEDPVIAMARKQAQADTAKKYFQNSPFYSNLFPTN